MASLASMLSSSPGTVANPSLWLYYHPSLVSRTEAWYLPCGPRLNRSPRKMLPDEVFTASLPTLTAAMQPGQRPKKLSRLLCVGVIPQGGKYYGNTEKRVSSFTESVKANMIVEADRFAPVVGVVAEFINHNILQTQLHLFAVGPSPQFRKYRVNFEDVFFFLEYRDDSATSKDGRCNAIQASVLRALQPTRPLIAQAPRPCLPASNFVLTAQPSLAKPGESTTLPDTSDHDSQPMDTNELDMMSEGSWIQVQHRPKHGSDVTSLLGSEPTPFGLGEDSQGGSSEERPLYEERLKAHYADMSTLPRAGLHLQKTGLKEFAINSGGAWLTIPAEALPKHLTETAVEYQRLSFTGFSYKAKLGEVDFDRMKGFATQKLYLADSPWCSSKLPWSGLEVGVVVSSTVATRRDRTRKDASGHAAYRVYCSIAADTEPREEIECDRVLPVIAVEGQNRIDPSLYALILDPSGPRGLQTQYRAFRVSVDNVLFLQQYLGDDKSTYDVRLAKCFERIITGLQKLK